MLLSGTAADDGGIYIGGTGIRTNGTVVWPAGTAEGDLALFSAVGNSLSTGSGLAYFSTQTIFGSSSRAGWKVLTSGDVSSYSVTVPTAGFYTVLVFRGPTNATQHSTPTSTGASVSVSGFTKTAGSQFVVSVGVERDPSLLDYVTSWDEGIRGQGTYFGMTSSWLASSAYNEAGWTQDLTASAYEGCAHAIELYA